MASVDDFVLVDHPRPRIARVTLNRPERMNAMAFDVMVPLAEALSAPASPRSADSQGLVEALQRGRGVDAIAPDLVDAR